MATEVPVGPVDVQQVCDDLVKYAAYRQHLTLHQTAHAMGISPRNAVKFELTITQLHAATRI